MMSTYRNSHRAATAQTIADGLKAGLPDHDDCIYLDPKELRDSLKVDYRDSSGKSERLETELTRIISILSKLEP